MRDDPLAMPSDTDPSFGRSFILVLTAHLALVALAWGAGKFFYKQAAPEPIVWLDGGGEIGPAAAPAPAAETTAPTPPDEPLPPPPEVPPPVPVEPPVVPKEPAELSPEPRPTPTPTPKPKPTPTPTPRPKPAVTPKPATPKTTPKKVAGTPAPKNQKTAPAAIAKAATPRPGPKPAPRKPADALTGATAAGRTASPAPSGSGNATAAGTKGGPGAPGGADSVLLGYFKKVEAQFHEVWNQPLTVVNNGREVAAHVRLRALPDGTVESLTLEKRTGNAEVDQSIEQALRRVQKVARPPAELLRDGVLDEMVAFILEL